MCFMMIPSSFLNSRKQKICTFPIALKELYLEPANATSKILAQYVAGNAAENTYGNSIPNQSILSFKKL